MQNINKLANAFGRADDGFVDNVYNTLASLQKATHRKPVRLGFYRLAAAIAIICALSAGIALTLSNTWGILDFLSGRRADVTVLPEASAIVQTEVPQEGNQTDIAAFTVREAVYDGQSVFIVLDVKPSSPDYLLLGPDVYPSDHIASMGPVFGGATGTIDDYAR